MNFTTIIGGKKKKAEKDKGNKEHMGLGKNTRRQTHLNI